MSQRVASLFAEIGAKTDTFERGAKKVKDELKSIAPGLEKVTRGVTGFISSNAALIGVLGGAALALNKISKDTVAYANAVRQQAQISGTSTEAASRYIQVLDDYKISSDEALVATRALTNSGHVPSIETLARLSDQYLKLGSQQEKNEFILKNLGRGGLQWVEVLNKGSDALLKQGDAVSKNLILSQKQVDAARKLELAEDAKNDALQAVSVTIGNKLIPVQTDFLNGVNVLIRGLDILSEKGSIWGATTEDFMKATDQAGREIWQEQEAMVAAADAANDTGSSMEDLTETQKDAEASAKALSSVYTGLLSSMFDIQHQNDSYADTLADLAQESEDLVAEKNKLILKMNEEKEAGKLTNDEYMQYVENLAEITKAQEENKQAVADAGKEQQDASKQRVYDLAEQKLAADGVVTSGEYEYLQNLAVSYGLVSRAAADQAISEEQRASALVASFEQTLPPAERTLSVLQDLAALNGTVVDFGVNFSSNVPDNPYSAPLSSGGGGTEKRDAGGQGMAGQPYMIGTGAQPEMFVPETNGHFIPNADKMGATYNIVVNNPKKETAESSIRRSLKKLSYIGVAA